MLIGAHVSSKGGVHNAPVYAYAEGCETFQFFSRPPQGGTASAFTDEHVRTFKELCATYHLTHSYIHAPYFINLASKNTRIRYGSIHAIREELERGSQLGVRAIMTHLGSANDFLKPVAIEKTIEAIKKILDGYHGATQFLIEIAAGAGNVLGSSFEEIERIIAGVNDESIGVCLDTCHAFASGYDMRTKETVNMMLRAFDASIGLQRLTVIHANDSKGERGGHLDRHEHIGKGKIGAEGFSALVNDPRIQTVDCILETPSSGRVNDIQTLKEMRGAVC